MNIINMSIFDNNKSIAKSCIHCGTVHILNMSEPDYYRWQVENQYVQDVFPHLNIDTRETAISGTCKECWDKIFG